MIGQSPFWLDMTTDEGGGAAAMLRSEFKQFSGNAQEERWTRTCSHAGSA